ncbi:btaf1 RNA polymerase II, B-TFIID transcription factor-associated, 170kDa, partial [Halocaridina rubra]
NTDLEFLTGGILHLLSKSGVYGVLKLLETLLTSQDWEARHGGLLGLKYLLAVRDDMISELLTLAYPNIYRGLQDEMDDVVAVAASCLVPVADSVVMLLNKAILEKLVTTLWDSLLDIDDLTSSTSSILMLLAKLLSHPSCQDSMHSNLSELVPRLWPFFYHNSSSVRGSALKTLETLTSCSANHGGVKIDNNDTHHITSNLKEKNMKVLWSKSDDNMLIKTEIEDLVFEANETNAESVIPYDKSTLSNNVKGRD